MYPILCIYRKDTVAVLPQLLSRLSLSCSDNSLQLVLLEGTPNKELLDCLQWITKKEESLMHFPNMVSSLLDTSIKFIIIVSLITDVLLIFL